MFIFFVANACSRWLQHLWISDGLFIKEGHPLRVQLYVDDWETLVELLCWIHPHYPSVLYAKKTTLMYTCRCNRENAAVHTPRTLSGSEARRSRSKVSTRRACSSLTTSHRHISFSHSFSSGAQVNLLLFGDTFGVDRHLAAAPLCDLCDLCGHC